MGERKLTTDERVALKYMAVKTGLLWGGVYDRGGDPLVESLLQSGLIEGVAKPYSVGKSTFAGGYRITDAGRSALEASK